MTTDILATALALHATIIGTALAGWHYAFPLACAAFTVANLTTAVLHMRTTRKDRSPWTT